MNLMEIEREMRGVSGWALESNAIEKDFSFSDFSEAMKFVNKVAEISEKHNHHPSIIISYNAVKLTLTTHGAGGLTKLDFEVAKDIDDLENINN